MRHTAFTLVALLLLSSAAVFGPELAQAQEQPPVMQQPTAQPVAQPTAQPMAQPTAQPMAQPTAQPVVQQPGQPAPGQQQGGVQVIDQSQAQTAPTSRGLEYGAHLIVPIFLASNSDVGLSPGIGIQGRIGWEFPGGFTTELNIGAMVNGSSADWVDASGASVGGYSMTNLWLGAGVRYAFLNPSAFVPFVGAGIVLNFFNDAITVGGITDSSGSSVITFGANALVGFAYELSRYIALEGGVQINYTIPPTSSEIAAQPEVWLSPFLGGTLYY